MGIIFRVFGAGARTLLSDGLASTASRICNLKERKNDVLSVATRITFSKMRIELI